MRGYPTYIANNTGGTLGALALLAATGVGVAAIVVLATKGRFWNDVLKPVLIGVAVAATLVLAALIAFGVVAYIAAASKSKGGANLSHFRNGFGRFPGWSPYPRPVPILEAVVIGLMIQNVLKKEPICIPKSRKKSFEKEMETKEEVMPVFDEQINILEEKDLDYLQSGFLEFSTGMVSENPELFKGKFTGFNTPDTAYNESLESIRGQNYHSGVMKTLKVIRDNGRWPGIETDIAKIAMLDKSTPVKERLAVQLAAMKVNPDPLLALNFAKCLHALNKKEQAIKVLAYQGLIVEKAKDQVADIRTAKAHQHFNQLSALWLKEIGY